MTESNRQQMVMSRNPVRQAVYETLRQTVPEGSIPDTDTDVLIAVLFAMESTDREWAKRGMPGTPSARDYARAIPAFLEKRYLS